MAQGAPTDRMLVVGRAPATGAGRQELVLGGGIRMRPAANAGGATVYFY